MHFTLAPQRHTSTSASPYRITHPFKAVNYHRVQISKWHAGLANFKPLQGGRRSCHVQCSVSPVPTTIWVPSAMEVELEVVFDPLPGSVSTPIPFSGRVPIALTVVACEVVSSSDPTSLDFLADGKAASTYSPPVSMVALLFNGACQANAAVSHRHCVQSRADVVSYRGNTTAMYYVPSPGVVQLYIAITYAADPTPHKCLFTGCKPNLRRVQGLHHVVFHANTQTSVSLR